MYLAQRTVYNSLCYTISRSFQQGGWWQSEDLIDLGEDPARFVVEAETGGFAVEARIGEELARRGAAPAPGELEELFGPFAPLHLWTMRQRWWQRRQRRRPRRLSNPEQKRLAARIPLFDRRRLCYLKTGAPDLAAINILPICFFLELADKSRDEIEQDFLAREQHLEPAGRQHYLFAVFNLQPWFIYLENRSMPPELDGPYLDQLFFQELCRINADPRYWMQEDPPPRLHPHLIRYATLFFDTDWSWSDFREEEGRRYRGRERQPPPGTAEGRAEGLFGTSIGTLRAMSRKELTHLYKRRALQLHPDQGGDPGEFVLLTQVYEALLKERGP